MTFTQGVNIIIGENFSGKRGYSHIPNNRLEEEFMFDTGDLISDGGMRIKDSRLV